jgi:hypothetical protein
MFRTINCTSSGGILYRQFTVFHHASKEESSRWHDTDDTWSRQSFVSCQRLSLLLRCMGKYCKLLVQNSSWWWTIKLYAYHSVHRESILKKFQRHGSENVKWFSVCVCVFKNMDGINDLQVWLPERECVLPKIHVKENLSAWWSSEYRHLRGTLNDTCCTHPRLQADLRSWPRLANLSMPGKISACSTRKSERSFTHFVFIELQNWISEAAVLSTCFGVYWAAHRWRVWDLVSFFLASMHFGHYRRLMLIYLTSICQLVLVNASDVPHMSLSSQEKRMCSFASFFVWVGRGRSFLFSKDYRLSLGPSQLPVQCVPG